MIKLYGHPVSTCTRKVLTALAETNTPHEFVVVDITKAEHKQAPHLARQPFGQVPAMDDDGFALHECRAMARYINEKSGGKLVPTDMKKRAEMEQWISIEMSYFTPHAMTFIYHHIFKATQSQAALDAAKTSLESCLKVMNDHLAKSTMFVGNDFTVADICFMPYVGYCLATPAKEILSKYPHVMSWWNRVSERPSWRKATGN